MSQCPKEWTGQKRKTFIRINSGGWTRDTQVKHMAKGQPSACFTEKTKQNISFRRPRRPHGGQSAAWGQSVGRERAGFPQIKKNKGSFHVGGRADAPPRASPGEAARMPRRRSSLPGRQRAAGQGRARGIPLWLGFLPAWPRTCPARRGSSRSWRRLNAAARPPPPAKGAPWPQALYPRRHQCARLRAQSPRASEVPEPGLPTTTPPRKSGRRSPASPGRTAAHVGEHAAPRVITPRRPRRPGRPAPSAAETPGVTAAPVAGGNASGFGAFDPVPGPSDGKWGGDAQQDNEAEGSATMGKRGRP